jgi:hypothetical protein
VAEELIFQVGYVAIALVGLWQFHCAAAKWAVLLNAPTWPTATAKLRGARVDYTESRRLANPSDITDPSYYHSVDIGPFFSTVTDRYYVPNLRFTYDHGGETITTDNLAPHNRHAVYFNRDDVAAIVNKYEALRTFPIRYHPNRPGHVFLGPRHFPYVATLLQTVGGLFFTLSLHHHGGIYLDPDGAGRTVPGGSPNFPVHRGGAGPGVWAGAHPARSRRLIMA